MIWIAPSEKDTDNAALEKCLWDTAEQAGPASHFAEAEYHSARPEGLLGILYLAPNARFDFLVNLPEAKDIGAKVNDAMRDVAKCEVRAANSEVQSVRHSKFVIRYFPVSASPDEHPMR